MLLYIFYITQDLSQSRKGACDILKLCKYTWMYL